MQLYVSVICFNFLFCYTNGASLKQQIFDSLVNNSYDKRVPPGVDFGELEEERPTNVSVQLFITEIYDVNAEEMDFSITFYLRQQWVDYRLMFDDRTITLQLDQDSIQRIWTPDTYFPEAKEGYFHDLTKPNILTHVFSNGTVIYSMRLVQRLSCSMDFHLYPMDVQRCKFHLESYGFTSDKVAYSWFGSSPVKVESDNLPLYDVPKDPPTEVSLCNHGYYLDDPGFSCLVATIELNRSIGYYMTEFFIPDILIVILSWVTFWLHPTAVPARVSLGVVTVLTMSSQGSASRGSAPKVSYIKALDIWTLFQVIFVFSAMIEFSIVNVLSRKKLKIKTAKNDLVTNERPFLAQAKRIDVTSRVLFPVAYIMFNIVFWSNFLYLKHMEQKV